VKKDWLWALQSAVPHEKRDEMGFGEAFNRLLGGITRRNARAKFTEAISWLEAHRSLFENAVLAWDF